VKIEYEPITPAQRVFPLRALADIRRERENEPRGWVALTWAGHTVEVTAATLYEAVALGLKQIRGNDWVEGIAGALKPVTVCVKNVQVEPTVFDRGILKMAWAKRQKSSRDDRTKDD
jgi:hypothetical protein